MYLVVLSDDVSMFHRSLQSLGSCPTGPVGRQRLGGSAGCKVDGAHIRWIASLEDSSRFRTRRVVFAKVWTGR